MQNVSVDVVMSTFLICLGWFVLCGFYSEVFKIKGKYFRIFSHIILLYLLKIIMSCNINMGHIVNHIIWRQISRMLKFSMFCTLTLPNILKNVTDMQIFFTCYHFPGHSYDYYIYTSNKNKKTLSVHVNVWNSTNLIYFLHYLQFWNMKEFQWIFHQMFVFLWSDKIMWKKMKVWKVKTIFQFSIIFKFAN